MKKFGFSILVLSMISTSLFAWHVASTNKSASDQYDHTVICDSGRAISVVENTSINRFFVNGNSYGSMSQAVSANCN